MNLAIRRLVGLLLLVVFLASCAYRSAIRKGDAALEAGNWELAVSHYERALDRKPDSEEATEKLRQANELIVGEAAEEARNALAAGDLIGAMDAAAAAFETLPEARATKTVVADVSNATFARAQELEKQGDFANAVVLYQSLGATLPTEKSKTEPAAESAQTAWVDQLKAYASDAEANDRPGDEILAWAKLAQLTGAPEHGGKRDALRKRILGEWAYWVKLETRGVAQELTNALTIKSATHALRVTPKLPSATKPLATARVKLDRVRYETDERTRTESVQYESGTKQVENPFYESRQDDLLREQRRLTDYENDVTKYENDVSRYEEAVAREGDTPNTSTGAEQNLSRARSSLESARRKVQDQRNQVQRARERLADEPPTKEEPVYSTHSFTVTTHILRASSTLNVTISHPDGRPAIDVSVPLAREATDDAHPAQSIAGVAEDPLSLPSRASLRGAVLADAREATVRLFTKSFDEWRNALVDRAIGASDDNERVNLLGIYIVTDPASVAPKVAADISAMRGIPDPVKILTP